jgi:hypothetical protein
MSIEENKKGQGKEERMPPAETGNASNPSPANDDLNPVQQHQLIDERGEKYLREVSSPEDYPDDEDWEEASKTLNDNKKD